MSDRQHIPGGPESSYRVNIHKSEGPESPRPPVDLTKGPQGQSPAMEPSDFDSSPTAATRGTRLSPVLLGVMAAAIAIVVAFVASSLIGGDDKENQRVATPDAKQSSEGITSLPGGTSIPPKVVNTELSYENMRDLVFVHYADLPSNPRATWGRLDPHFTSMTDWNDYLIFWSTIGSVTVDSVTPRGPDSVVARLTYVLRDGRSNTEDRWLRFVSTPNGLRIYESGRIGTVT